MTQANRLIYDLELQIKKNDSEFNANYRKLYVDFQNIARQVVKKNNILLIDFWLLPIIVIILLLSLLIDVAQGSAVAAFIYTLF